MDWPWSGSSSSLNKVNETPVMLMVLSLVCLKAEDRSQEDMGCEEILHFGQQTPTLWLAHGQPLNVKIKPGISAMLMWPLPDNAMS